MSLIESEISKTTTITLQNGQVLNITSDAIKKLDTLPVIDVSGIYSDNLNDRKAVAEQIRAAAHDIGFFYAINHGVNPKYTQNTFEQAKRFFELPIEKKMEVYTGLVPNEHVGYHPMEHYARAGRPKKDLCEAFNWAYDAKFDTETLNPNEPSINIWPDSVPGFKETLFEHHAEMLAFSRKMTRIFAFALHLDESAFDDYIKRPEADMRIIHYP